MASTYSTSLRLELMATGDQSGTWGDTTNTNLGTLLEQAITGVLSVAQGDVANLTLTTVNGGSDQARNAVVNITGALTAARNVVVQTANKLYLIKNSTTGGFSLTAKTVAGTGIVIPPSSSQWVYSDGTNVVAGLIGNMPFNNLLQGYTTTATAAGTTTLDVTSTHTQYFTGSTTQTVTLPVTSTLVLGQEFEIVNLSSGALTVNSSGANLVVTVTAGATARVQVILTSGTSAASWNVIAVVVAAASTSAAGIVQLATDAQVLAATSTSLVVVPASIAAERLLTVVGANLGFSASVGAGALTVTMLGANGSAVSATNPVTVPFRNVTAATGTPSNLTVTSATSLAISSGSTMGFTSAVIGKLWIVGFNDAGTFRLGLVNALSGTSIMALADGIYSSTAEGGAGGADSAQVIYTGTAVTSKAMTVLGYLEATEATAGTWATTPSALQIRTPSTPLPGTVVQIKRTATGAVATGTTAIPLDDTIPQSTEGDQYMSQAITPQSATNLLSVQSQCNVSGAASTYVGAALFQDSVANALVAELSFPQAGTRTAPIPLSYSALAASTASTTFKVRGGTAAADTCTFNGASGARQYGGVMNSFIEVREIAA